MTRKREPEVFSPTELEEGLRRMGIQELQQRLEFSPLLIDHGLNPGEESMATPCCVCKIGDPGQLDENGMLPYPQFDPTGLK